MVFNGCETKEEFETYRITITNQQGTVLFEREGQLDYTIYVKTFNGEAHADIYVYDRKNIRLIYQISGVGIQINKEYLEL
jgi:hypothetical protein